MGDPRSRAAAAAQCYRHAGVRGQRRQRPDDSATLFVPARGPDPARPREDLPRLGAWVLVPASRRVRCRRRGIPHQRWLEPPVPSPGDLVVAMTSVLLVKGILMNSPSFPEGPGSVSGAPNLPDGFAGTFTSRYIDTGDLRQHVVTGGDGPPLLLVHGWPQTWYAWRLVMPALARDFQVVAVDQRGIGLSDKPRDGYDTGTLASDLVALMD